MLEESIRQLTEYVEAVEASVQSWKARAEQLEKERLQLQALVESLSERVVAQAELLSKRAERS